MPLPKNFWKPQKKYGAIGAYTWYASRAAVFLGAIIGSVWLMEFARDMYRKAFRNNGQQPGNGPYY